MHPHICTEPTGFIIAIGSDPGSYKGSQQSLPPADNQRYEGDDGVSGEVDNCKEGTDGGVSGDDDQSLKKITFTPSSPPISTSS